MSVKFTITPTHTLLLLLAALAALVLLPIASSAQTFTAEKFRDTTYAVVRWHDPAGCSNQYLIVGSDSNTFATKKFTYVCGHFPSRGFSVINTRTTLGNNDYARMVCDTNGNGTADNTDRIIGTSRLDGTWAPNVVEEVKPFYPESGLLTFSDSVMGYVQYLSSYANNTAILMTFSRPIDSGALPSAGDFTLNTLESEIPGGVTVSSVSVHPHNNRILVLETSKQLPYLAHVEVSYTPGSNPLRSTAPHAEARWFRTGWVGYENAAFELRYSHKIAINAIEEGAGTSAGSLRLYNVNIDEYVPTAQTFVAAYLETAVLDVSNAATAGEDFVAIDREPLVMPAGSDSAPYSVSIIDDTMVEENERFRLLFIEQGLRPSEFTLKGVEFTYEVLTLSSFLPFEIEDDDTSVISLEDVDSSGIASYTVTEGGTVDIPIVLTNPIGYSIGFEIFSSTPPGTASSADWSWQSGIKPDGVLTIPAGTTRHVITLAATADSVADSGETVKVELNNRLLIYEEDITIDNLKRKIVVTINE